MGGKDSIIVDADCDLEAAVEGVAASAFGFNGQKCSACSRAIVDERVYDVFVDRLRERVERIMVGNPAENFGAGPVISENSFRKVMGYIELGKAEGPAADRRCAGRAGSRRAGISFSRPSLWTSHRTARIAQEEIFGPVLAVIKSKSYDDALEIANNTEYGLTGAVYSRLTGTAGTRARGVPRGQPLLQPKVHRCDGWSASIWRLQHERHGLQGGRPGLSAAVYAGEEYRGEDWVC